MGVKSWVGKTTATHTSILSLVERKEDYVFFILPPSSFILAL